MKKINIKTLLLALLIGSNIFTPVMAMQKFAPSLMGPTVLTATAACSAAATGISYVINKAMQYTPSAILFNKFTYTPNPALASTLANIGNTIQQIPSLSPVALFALPAKATPASAAVFDNKPITIPTIPVQPDRLVAGMIMGVIVSFMAYICRNEIKTTADKIKDTVKNATEHVSNWINSTPAPAPE